MSLLLGNLRDLIGDLWDGSDVPEPDSTGPVEPQDDEARADR